MKNAWTPWSRFVRNIIYGDILTSNDFKGFIALLNDHNVIIIGPPAGLKICPMPKI
jgi:hypothetical protein